MLPLVCATRSSQPCTDATKEAGQNGMNANEHIGSSHGPANDPPVLRFSTDMFPERERIEAWRECFGRGILKLDIEPMGNDAFHSDVTLRALPGLGFVAGK